MQLKFTLYRLKTNKGVWVLSASPAEKVRNPWGRTGVRARRGRDRVRAGFKGAQGAGREGEFDWGRASFAPSLRGSVVFRFKPKGPRRKGVPREEHFDKGHFRRPVSRSRPKRPSEPWGPTPGTPPWTARPPTRRSAPKGRTAVERGDGSREGRGEGRGCGGTGRGCGERERKKERVKRTGVGSPRAARGAGYRRPGPWRSRLAGPEDRRPSVSPVAPAGARRLFPTPRRPPRRLSSHPLLASHTRHDAGGEERIGARAPDRNGRADEPLVHSGACRATVRSLRAAGTMGRSARRVGEKSRRTGRSGSGCDAGEAGYGL